MLDIVLYIEYSANQVQKELLVLLKELTLAFKRLGWSSMGREP